MRTINFIALIIGAFAFNFIFWKEDLAFNFTLFSLFSIAINFFNSPEMFSRPNVLVTTAGNILACFFLLYHHSLVSMIAAITSWIVMVGFYQLEELRTVHRAFVSSVFNFFKLPPFLLDVNWSRGNMSQKSIIRKLGIIIFPLIALVIFYSIFLGANPVFSDLNEEVWKSIEWFFVTYLFTFSIERVLFFIFGFLISSWFIYKAMYGYIYEGEKLKTSDLFRIRKKKKPSPMHYSPASRKGLSVGLKSENLSGVIMMAMIVVLLLVINIIDIVYVWFGNEYNPTRDYSADVHKGVNLLILSIFLSIFIMIYYFRRNQNFYKKNHLLKQMAYIWIMQNVILIISVIFRNMHYIQFHGLTQKRIGVYIFLIVVTIGLLSLTLKIAQRKSFFFLSRFNSWSLYGVLIFLSCFNWDMIIFKHNFSHRKEKTIDLTYLIDLNDEVILEIDKHKTVLFKEYHIDEMAGHFYSRSGRYEFDERLQQIKNDVKYDQGTIFSWNYRREKIKRIVEDRRSSNSRKPPIQNALVNPNHNENN